DHSAVLLMPKYKQRLKQESPAVREVTWWTQRPPCGVHWIQWTGTCFDAARRCSQINEFTEAIVGFITKMVEDTTPITTIRTFPNQKPLVDKTVRDTLRACTAAYKHRCLDSPPET
ncbi:hypothetical protein JOB18_035091, partial [Solea senegalensis]